MLLVAVSWILGAVVAALPFYFWGWFSNDIPPDHPFQSFVGCYFEAMSGLTTTGATVLGDIETLPDSLLLWRATTHWLGGLGIVVLFVAVLPTLGVGGKKLVQFETSGPQKPGVRPRIRETARVLWIIYLSFTLVLIVSLKLMGLSWIDAICRTFATLATGGFSTRNASVGAFPGYGVASVIVLFMFLAGVNFGLYYQILRGRWRESLRDPEFRVYLGLVVLGSLLLMALLWGSAFPLTQIDPVTGERRTAEGAGPVALHAVFQAVAIQTGTGFATANTDVWPFFAKAILFAVMFVGASAGSTAGGLKVIRFVIIAKLMVAEIEKIFRPNVVRPIRVGKAIVSPEVRQGALLYFAWFGVLFLSGSLLLMAVEFGRIPNMDFLTASSAAVATLCNVGPGFGLVGAVDNYGWFSGPSLLIMSLFMALGRLEIFAILVLVLPRFWRGE